MPIEYQEHVVRENQDLIIFLIAFRYLRPVFFASARKWRQDEGKRSEKQDEGKRGLGKVDKWGAEAGAGP
jgi:hypothetical protein